MTLQDALRKFLDSKRAAGRSERTLDWYDIMIRQFAQWLEDNEYGANWFAPATIEQYLAEGRARGLKPASIAGQYRALHVFFRWLRDREYLPEGTRLPTERIPKPQTPQTRPNVTGYEEFERLLASIEGDHWVESRDRLMVATLFLTGIRRKNLVGLRIPDYRLDEGILYVEKTKNGSDHTVPLLDPVVQAFEAYMSVRPDWKTDHVFLSAKVDRDTVRGVCGGSGCYQRLKLLCKRAGMRQLNPHSFRHGLAVYLLNERGADIGLIQRLLGHDRIEVTQQSYARWNTNGISAQYRKLMVDA